MIIIAHFSLKLSLNKRQITPSIPNKNIYDAAVSVCLYVSLHNNDSPNNLHYSTTAAEQHTPSPVVNHQSLCKQLTRCIDCLVTLQGRSEDAILL